MRQLDFAAEPNYIQEFREVQRLFRQDLAVPLQAMTRQLLHQVMRDLVANQVQAGWHQRGAPQRAGYRNGSYPRRLLTTVGEILLDVPRTREHASPVTQVVERYQRRMPELDAMIRQVFLRGVSTRQTGAVLEALCGKTLSATSVSRLTGMLEVWHQTADSGRRYLLPAIAPALGGTLRRRPTLRAIDGHEPTLARGVISLQDLVEHVADLVGPAQLVAGVGEHQLQRPVQTGAAVGRHQLQRRALESAVLEGLQQGLPGGVALRSRDLEVDHLLHARGGDAVDTQGYTPLHAPGLANAQVDAVAQQVEVVIGKRSLVERRRRGLEHPGQPRH
jgi:hypothetical protein